MNDLHEITSLLEIKFFIWGGFVQDILEKRFLREHKDLDVFIEYLEENKGKLTQYFTEKKYNCKYIEEISMLVIEIEGKHASMNSLIYKEDSAIWRHIGEQGFISFPKIWLENNLILFYNIPVRISGVNFEFCFRSIIKALNPEWKTRNKDIDSLKFYDGIIKKTNSNIEEMLTKIWSYNPFWQTKGYCGYEKPVIVLGKEYIKEAQQRVQADSR